MAVVIGAGSGNAISINSSVGSAGQVIVSDGTNSSWGSVSVQSFDFGTRLMFAQAEAPTGWTRVTDDSANNRMLRVVSSGGGLTGGSASPILNDVVPAHTHSFTTGGTNTDTNHLHGYTASNNTNFKSPAGGAFSPFTVNAGVFSANTGAADRDINHSHSGSTDNGSSQTNWAPRYIDMILCYKN